MQAKTIPAALFAVLTLGLAANASGEPTAKEAEADAESATSATGTVLSSSEFDFRVTVPPGFSNPDKNVTQSDGKKVVVWHAKRGDDRCFVGAVTFSNKDLANITPRDAISAATKGALGNMKAKINRSEKHVTWYGHPAETAYAVTSKTGDKKYVRYQATLANENLFQVFCIVDDEATLKTPPIVSFFGSFRAGSKLVTK